MGSTALITAGVAAALLVVVLGADVTMTATYSLDIWTGSAWRELARAPYAYESRAVVPFGPSTISANASDDLRFRLEIDNGYYWGKSETFRVYHANEEIASDVLSAGSRSVGSREFVVGADRFLASDPSGAREPVKTDGALTYADLQVEVDGEILYASFQIREVTAS